MSVPITNNDHLTNCCKALDESGFCVTVASITDPNRVTEDIHMAHGAVGNYVLVKLKADIAEGNLYPAEHYIDIATQLREAERRLRHRTVVEAAVQHINLLADIAISRAADQVLGGNYFGGDLPIRIAMNGVNAALSEAIATQIADKE